MKRSNPPPPRSRLMNVTLLACERVVLCMEEEGGRGRGLLQCAGALTGGTEASPSNSSSEDSRAAPRRPRSLRQQHFSLWGASLTCGGGRGLVAHTHRQLHPVEEGCSWRGGGSFSPTMASLFPLTLEVGKSSSLILLFALFAPARCFALGILL